MAVIKSSIKEIHDVMLSILIEFKRVCDLHNLRYYLACGTCLGAMRHQGFIPWDHDVDVFMYYDDIQKLLALKNEFGGGYFLQGHETDPSFGRTYRLQDTRTTFIHKDAKDTDGYHGISLDIYPLYCAPNNIFRLKYNIVLSHFYTVFSTNRPPLNHGIFAKCLFDFILSIINKEQKEKIVAHCKQELTRYKDGKDVLTYFGEDIFPLSALTYEKCWFEEPSKVTFEGIIFDGPTDPDAYLRKKYGDYMMLPPIEERKSSFDDFICIDAQNSYLDYKGVYYLT